MHEKKACKSFNLGTKLGWASILDITLETIP
jgi:hypothetical protein